MRIQDLKAALDHAGVNPDAYSIETGYMEDSYVLTREPPGRWVIYFGERGSRWDLRLFESEEEACAHFLQWILKDVSTRLR